MSSFESFLLSYLLNSLWQVPLLFAAGWLAARFLRSANPAAEHRVWVGVLLLEALLPAGFMLTWRQPWAWLQALSGWGSHAGSAGQAHVSIAMGPGVAAGVLHVPATLLNSAAILYGVVLAYFLARFLWRSRALAALRREAVDVVLTGEAAACWARCTQRFGIDGATVAASSRIFGPVTLGLRRKLVLLPVSMVAGLPRADLETVLAHECAHMHRNDFLKNLLYDALSLPVSYHPLLWLTRSRMVETREMLCDRMAAQLAGRDSYARSLLRLASLLVRESPLAASHAIGIFDANTFERRLMKLTGKHNEMRGVRRAAALGACVVLGAVTCGSALALRMHVDAAANAAQPAAPDRLTVKGSVMAGNNLTKVNPKYPEAAKKAKIQGTVLVNALIRKDGEVGDAQVVSGPDELRQSTLDAVRQWTYKPYLLNGNPVEVKTTVRVTYSLRP